MNKTIKSQEKSSNLVVSKVASFILLWAQNTILTLKHLQIMKVLPLLSSVKLKSECVGMKGILRGLFSKYWFNPGTSRVERVASKTCQNFDEFKMFIHEIDSFQLKVSILSQKYLQIMQVLPVFSSVKLNSEYFGSLGMTWILGKKIHCVIMVLQCHVFC